MNTPLKEIKIGIILIIALSTLGALNAGIVNPATAYCEGLGYTYEYDSITGSENCILPNGQTVIAWEFLLGQVAQEYSYCEKNGLKLKIITDPIICSDLGLETCAVCQFPDGEEKEVTQAMKLNLITNVCGDGFCHTGETFENCQKDCSSGTDDGYCDKVADSICDADCIIQQMPASDADCPYCGDGTCNPDENYKTCKSDCISGFEDNYCDGISDGRCDPDCTDNFDPDCECGDNVCEGKEVGCVGDCTKGFPLKWVVIGLVLLILFGLYFYLRKKRA